MGLIKQRGRPGRGVTRVFTGRPGREINQASPFATRIVCRIVRLTMRHRQDRLEFVFVLRIEHPSTDPLGSLANASSVGAKTVKGPLPFRLSTRSAALTAATSVSNLAAIAVSTMSFAAARTGA